MGKRYRYPFNALPVGEVSSGTLRTQDLIFAWAAVLSPLRLSRSDRAELRRAVALARRADRWTDAEAEEASDLLNEALYYITIDHTPPYCYSGSLEGDGACVGIWPDTDAIEEARREEELPDVDSLPTGYSGEACAVSDHGSFTLYIVTRGRAREVWSVA